MYIFITFTPKIGDIFHLRKLHGDIFQYNDELYQ